ncbi:hypothetical protein U0070_010142 [Myodes glareolus]|uniref:Uncharacterized protein n=1 Tax=Myodes glareolus TaxID=447135 RepID=A0AAW0I3I6_MYOGA
MARGSLGLQGTKDLALKVRRQQGHFYSSLKGTSHGSLGNVNPRLSSVSTAPPRGQIPSAPRLSLLAHPT